MCSVAVFPYRAIFQMYLVRIDPGHEHCTCPDFQHRQSGCEQPCKHILALLNNDDDELERIDAELGRLEAA
jgi:hypothetical protein